MINHISIGVQNPERVANIIAELWGGYALPFPSCPGSYVAFADDGRGSMVEVIPAHVQLVPGMGLPDANGSAEQTNTSEFESKFEPDNETTLFGSVHLNINSPLDEKSIKAIAKRESWRCFTANRGGGLFQLIEFWIEDRFLIEVNTPEMTARYVEIATPQTLADFLQMPLPTKYPDTYAGLVG